MSSSYNWSKGFWLGFGKKIELENSFAILRNFIWSVHGIGILPLFPNVLTSMEIKEHMIRRDKNFEYSAMRKTSNSDNECLKKC